MASNDEKSKVAYLARMLAKAGFDFDSDNVAKAIGANRYFPDEAWNKLAHLVEPPESHESAQECDRESLLGIADELEICIVNELNHLGESDRFSGVVFSRRIREALGVEHAES